MDNILTLFTSEDKKEVVTAIKKIILKQIEHDFENNCNYLLNPNDVEDMVYEVVSEVKDEVKELYKQKLLKEMEEKLNL